MVGLRSGRNVIGRSDECDVVLQDGQVSGNHALVYLKEGESSFVDTSRNGSVVDGAAVLGDKVALADTARIEIGSSRLIFVRVPKAMLKGLNP